MKCIIRLTARQELNALPILLRHSPGMVLPDRTYVIDVEAARALREARIAFTLLCNESATPTLEELAVRVRI